MAQQPSLLDHGLVVVTGKGGVGKTTVATTLGLLGARAGLRTVVAEVAGQRRAPAMLGHPTAGAPGTEEEVEPELWTTTIDPEGALAEWAGRIIRPRALVELAIRSRAFSGFVAAAPGGRELLTITKAWELGEPRRWRPGARQHDLVILDAPASGHGLGMLRTPRTFFDIAKVGPIASQAGEVDVALRDPGRTAIVAVATAEETPVNETLELQDALEAQLGNPPSLIVANGILRDTLSAADARAVEGAAGILPPAVRGTLRARHARTSRQAAQLRRLRRGARAPVVALPFLAGHGIGPDEVEVLADVLGRRATSSRRVP